MIVEANTSVIIVIKTICKSICCEVGKCTSKQLTPIYRDKWRTSNERNTCSGKSASPKKVSPENLK